MKIVIFERVLTHYRLKFYNFLKEKHGVEVVFLTKEIPNKEGFITDENLAKFKIIKLKYITVLGLEFYLIPFEIIKQNSHFVFLLSFKCVLNFQYLLITRLLGKKFYWWGHSKNFSKNSFISRFLDVIKIKLIHFSNGILAYTEREKERFIKNNINPNKVIVLNNTVDTSKIFFLKSNINFNETKKIKNTYSLKNKIVIGLIGRLHKLRRAEIAIQVFQKLRLKYNNISLLIIGDGSEFGNLKKNYSNENIIFIGSIENEVKLAPYMNIIDFFLNPGLVGLNIIHCMAYGKPTITIKRSYHSPEIDYLESGTNGFVSQNKRNFYEHIEYLINDSKKLDELSKNCLLDSKNLTIENMALNFLKIYK